MKKLFSILLVLSLVLSMAPAVFAAETAETEQPVLEPVNQEELAAELVEAETAEAEARKEAEAEAELDPEADFRRLETELRAKDMIDRSQSEVDLFAASYDVTVKVKFPNAATEGGQMRVYLYQAAVKDEDGFVLQYPDVYDSKNVSVAEGDKSISATFSVPKGDYFVEVYTQNVQNGSYLYQEMFFNGDGTYTVSYPATMALRWSDETTDFEIKITSQLKTGKCVSVVLADKENGLVMKNDAGSEIPYTLSQTTFATTAPVVTDDVHPFSVNVTTDDWNAVSFDAYSDILTVTTSVADL